MKSGLAAFLIVLSIGSSVLAESNGPAPSGATPNVPGINAAVPDGATPNAGSIGAIASNTVNGMLAALLIEVAKMTLRDKRVDDKFAAAMAELALRLKEAKLEAEKNKIEAMKKEAQERYDRAMASAEYERTLGALSIAASMLTLGGATKAEIAFVMRDYGKMAAHELPGRKFDGGNAYSAGASEGVAGGITDGLLAVLMNEVAKAAQRDKREDDKLASVMVDAAERAKEAKLEAEKNKIDAMKREAKERYEQVLEAAYLDMVVGVIANLASTLTRGPTSAEVIVVMRDYAKSAAYDLQDRKLGPAASLPAKKGKADSLPKLGLQKDDDAALNAAFCKALAAKGQKLPALCRRPVGFNPPDTLDRLDNDRIDQLGDGRSGGFNPNKP